MLKKKGAHKPGAHLQRPLDFRYRAPLSTPSGDVEKRDKDETG